MTKSKETSVVIGLGYVGLSLSRELADSGMLVTGIDSNPDVISKIMKLAVPEDIIDRESLQKLFSLGFTATNEFSEISKADYVFICVPTPLDESGFPDTSYIHAASVSISKYLTTGTTVVLESTSYPGTTEEIVLQTLRATGFTPEIDFYVGFSSERVDPGSSLITFRKTPKVVAAYSEAGMSKMLEVYSRFIDEVIPTFKVREAELSKLIENSYRLINIAFINELARMSESLKIDLHEALRLSATKPFGFQSFLPSSGIGGHCIPIDPVYLRNFLQRSGSEGVSRILDAAINVNQNTTKILVHKIMSHLDQANASTNTTILLGMTYKKNSSDLRESPGVKIAKELDSRGVNFRYFDPLASSTLIPEKRITNNAELNSLISDGSTVVVLQTHDCLNLDAIIPSARLVLDTTHLLSGDNIVGI